MVYRKIPKAPALTEEQITALRDVSHGKTVASSIGRRLVTLGLIEQGLSGWTVTHQGQIQLMFRNAR
jgi:hypothetical protein